MSYMYIYVYLKYNYILIKYKLHIFHFNNSGKFAACKNTRKNTIYPNLLIEPHICTFLSIISLIRLLNDFMKKILLIFSFFTFVTIHKL